MPRRVQMTRKEVLTELLGRVEAWGNGSLVMLDFKDALDTLPSILRSKHNAAHAWDAFNGSLNAAKALHETVLPGWRWAIADGSGKCRAAVQQAISIPEIGASSNIASRSWLIAILKALIAETDNA